MVIASRMFVSLSSPPSLSFSLSFSSRLLPSTHYPPFDRVQTRSLQTAHHCCAIPRRYTARVRREWIPTLVTIDFKPNLIGFSRGTRAGVGNHQGIHANQRIGVSYEPPKKFASDLSVKRTDEKRMFVSKNGL